MRDREQILEEALEAENAGNATTARRLYQECVNAHPKFAQAWLLYACFLHAQNEWSEAIKVAARIKGEPSAERAAMSLTGCCWKELGETTKAVEAFRASIRLDPKIYDFVFLGVASANSAVATKLLKSIFKDLNSIRTTMNYTSTSLIPTRSCAVTKRPRSTTVSQLKPTRTMDARFRSLATFSLGAH